MTVQEVTSNLTGAVRPGATCAQVAGLVDEAAQTAGRPAPRDSAAAGSAALQVADLTKHFRSGFLRRSIRGIEGVSFAVRPGSVFALLGHNGAGKTTTINCILDLVHPDSGEVRILGCDHRRCASRARLGYLPERPYFFEHLSGRELLEFYATLQQVDKDVRRRRIPEVLERVSMTGAADRKLRKYSKGMLQRIGLAQALLGDPELLILDEPMSGLDPVGRREVRELLQELKALGKTIVLSSHIVPDVELLADTVGVLKEGRLVLATELDAVSGHCSYEVILGRPARGGWPEWAAAAGQPLAEDRLQLAAADVDGLRRLLDRCHDGGAPVLGVETRRSGLEELFMSAHGRGSQS